MSVKLNCEIEKNIKKKLLTYCKRKIFTCCSMAVKFPEKEHPVLVTVHCPDSIKSFSDKSDHTFFFDLASLTKPLVTLLSVLVLIDDRKISWNDSAVQLLSRFGSWKNNTFTIENLLSHQSGLPAHVEFWHDPSFLKNRNKKKMIIDRIMTLPTTGQSPLYSDLGYILLGFIIEEVTGITLDQFWSTCIGKMVGVERELNFPKNLPAVKGDYIPTGYCPFNGTPLYGIVHDDNCRLMGGVCGHAGLFGTIRGVYEICKEILDLCQGKRSRLPISVETMRKACLRKGTSEWTCGFNLPSPKGSSGGYLLSPDSIGHLGFTGTSFWIDRLKNMVIVLLTNRVYRGNDITGIRKMRPELHNLVADIIDKTPGR